MAQKGIWVDKNTFVEFAGDQQTGSLSKQIATRDRSVDFQSLSSFLPNPDPVLKKMGKDIKVYTDMLSDAHLGGCVKSRKTSVQSLEWEIDRGKGKSRQAKDIQKIFNDLDVYRIIGEMLNAWVFGYQPLEVIWNNSPLGRGAGVGSGLWYPKDIVGKPQYWFVFSEANELRFLSKDNSTNGEELPDKKFLLGTYEATYENPYGFAEMSRCFWPLTFKKGGFKFMVRCAEKYGMPFLWGKLPRGLTPKEYEDLATQLENMIQDAIAVTPDDASIEMITSTKSGSSGGTDIYSALIDACKTEMSIAVLGQNLTTEVKGGSFAATQGHMEVRQDIRDGDKKIPQVLFNTLIRWYCEWNYAERVSDYPQFIMYEEEDVDKGLADRDKLLSDTGQIRFTKKYFVKNYGFEEEDIVVNESMPSGNNSPQPPLNLRGGAEGGGVTAFAEESPLGRGAGVGFPDQAALDAAVKKIDPAALRKQMDGILKPVINLVENSGSYEEIRMGITETYPDMKGDLVEEMIARAIFTSETWGRINAKH